MEKKKSASKLGKYETLNVGGKDGEANYNPAHDPLVKHNAIGAITTHLDMNNTPLSALRKKGK
jgi:hypothetical protein